MFFVASIIHNIRKCFNDHYALHAANVLLLKKYKFKKIDDFLYRFNDIKNKQHLLKIQNLNIAHVNYDDQLILRKRDNCFCFTCGTGKLFFSDRIIPRCFVLFSLFKNHGMVHEVHD